MAESRPALNTFSVRYSSSPFGEAANADLYRCNAFRLTGLALTAGARDLSRFGERLEVLHRLNGGAPVTQQTAFPLNPPPSLDEVREALRRLRDPEQRLVHEFFWFWPTEWNTTAADAALAALAAGEIRRAAAIWRDGLDVPATRPAALHNLAVLEHLDALEAVESQRASKRPHGMPSWQDVYQRWAEVLRDDGIWSILRERVVAVDDPRVTPSLVMEFRDSLPSALLFINAAQARRAVERGEAREAAIHATAIRESGFDAHLVESSLRRLVEPEVTRIADACNAGMATARQDVKSGATAAEKLLEQTKAPIAVVDVLLPEGDARREELHDRVASAALSCLVLYANATANWNIVIPLTETVGRVAATTAVQARVAENVETAKVNLQLGTCWFCKVRPSDGPSAHKVAMHGDVEHETRFFQGTQVRWRQYAVEVPRCKECARAHGKIRSSTQNGFALGILVGLGSCIATVDENGLGALVLLVVCIVIGAFLGNRIGWSDAPKGMAPESTGRDSPMVKEFLRRGWHFGEKPANVN